MVGFFVCLPAFATSCDFAMEKNFYQRFTAADNIFTGVVIEVKAYTGTSSSSEVKFNKIAAVKVLTNWKGLLGGTVEILYQDGGSENCGMEYYHTLPGDAKYVFFTKKLEEKLITSRSMGSMGTTHEVILENIGAVDALRFLNREGVTKRDFDDFRKKHKAKMKLLDL